MDKTLTQTLKPFVRDLLTTRNIQIQSFQEREMCKNFESSFTPSLVIEQLEVIILMPSFILRIKIETHTMQIANAFEPFSKIAQCFVSYSIVSFINYLFKRTIYLPKLRLIFRKEGSDFNACPRWNTPVPVIALHLKMRVKSPILTELLLVKVKANILQESECF